MPTSVPPTSEAPAGPQVPSGGISARERAVPLTKPEVVSGLLTRRQAVGAGAGGLAALVLGGSALAYFRDGSTPRPVADLTIKPGPVDLEIGGRRVSTWAFDQRLPGRELRLRQGRPVRILVDNGLPQETSMHWHGLRIENRADGAPGFSQDPIGEGDFKLYAFTPPDAGTFFYHPHVGLQLDRGLYGPLVVEAADEPGRYDVDQVLMLDDWLDGMGPTPEETLKTLTSSGMKMATGGGRPKASATVASFTSRAGGAPPVESLAALANGMQSGGLDAGDVVYPMYLINGKAPDSPFAVDARAGDRVRLRLVNSAGDTTYAFWVENLEMTVTHTDGMPIKPVRTDAVLLGMGERYDVEVTVPDGPTRLIAQPLGKKGRAVATLKDRSSRQRVTPAMAPAPPPARMLSYADMRSTEPVVTAGAPRETRLDLGFTMPYRWTIGGTTMQDGPPIALAKGEAQRFVMTNRTGMPHPMHLHGHSFRIGGPEGPLKDTVTVPPRQTLAIDWVADNPGDWPFHCHDAYHLGAGMMRKVTVS